MNNGQTELSSGIDASTLLWWDDFFNDLSTLVSDIENRQNSDMHTQGPAPDPKSGFHMNSFKK